MKILHLIIDHQVIERMLGKYERLFPGCNDVIVFSNDNVIKHLNRYAKCPKITRKDVKSQGNSFDYLKYQFIVAHYLTLEMVSFISFAPSNIHVSWEIYGHDLYNQFLEPMGYQVQAVNKNKYLSLKAQILNRLGLLKIAAFVLYGDRTQFDFIKKRYFKLIANRLDSVQVGCDCDADLLEKYSGLKKPRFKTFNYSLEDVLGALYRASFNDDSNIIMIGNSASLSNNHLYVLDYIKNYQLNGDRIIMPLSYGGLPKYKKEVMDKYELFFKGKVSPILDYLPLHEYNKLFTDVKTMVMASWRQESLGTIIMGLYLGIKIYMSNRSPLYSSLKKEGFLIFSIEDTCEEQFLNALKNEEKLFNRNILLNNYNERVFDKELLKQFS